MKYPELLVSDCSVSTGVVEPNQAGSSSDRLPWFWSSARAGTISVPDSEHYNECETAGFCVHDSLINSTVFRVNWLCARAQ